MTGFNVGCLWMVTLLLAITEGCSAPAENGGISANSPSEGSSAPPAHAGTHASAAAAANGKAKDSAAPQSSPWDALGKLGSPKETAKSDSASAPLTPAPGKELTKAAVGMGEKGRGYGGGLVTTEVHTYWTVKEQLALGLIQHAMDLYKAEDPNGKGPRTQAEFMKKIIKDNDIKLPELPAGQRYLYDPVKEELLVEQPKEP
jgi:hypothetical protein